MKIVNRIKALWDSIFNPTMNSSTKAEQDHYEAMYQDFLKSKPAVVGIDPAEPGADRTVYHQFVGRQGKTERQRFWEQGVAAMAELEKPNDLIGTVKKINPLTREAVIDLVWIQNGLLPETLEVGDAIYTHPPGQQDQLKDQLFEARQALLKEGMRADALQARIYALDADASRYRWLRNDAWGCDKIRDRNSPHVCTFLSTAQLPGVVELAEEALDSAIDSAMKKR